MGGGEGTKFVPRYMNLIPGDGEEPKKWNIRLGHYLYWGLTSKKPKKRVPEKKDNHRSSSVKGGANDNNEKIDHHYHSQSYTGIGPL